MNWWGAFGRSLLESGSSEKSTPLQNVNYYQFVSHSYTLTGFFPIFFSCVFVKALTCGEECITDDELATSFFFISQIVLKQMLLDSAHQDRSAAR